MPPRKTKNQKIELAGKLCQWMLSVPKMRTTSPRFIYYADNWRVLTKIQDFEKSGELADIIKDSPAFGADELRAALDYLDRPETAEIARQATLYRAQRQQPAPRSARAA
jgi:hypothetical protein